jgi:hypothetical protein
MKKHFCVEKSQLYTAALFLRGARLAQGSIICFFLLELQENFNILVNPLVFRDVLNSCFSDNQLTEQIGYLNFAIP